MLGWVTLTEAGMPYFTSISESLAYSYTFRSLAGCTQGQEISIVLKKELEKSSSEALHLPLVGAAFKLRPFAPLNYFASTLQPCLCAWPCTPLAQILTPTHGLAFWLNLRPASSVWTFLMIGSLTRLQLPPPLTCPAPLLGVVG